MPLLVLARIGVRVTRPGRRRICGSIVFGQNALMPMVQGLEGRPLWGRAVYTALHGARLSSVPSGDQFANPASVLGHSGLQRALLSVSSAQKCSGDGRLATPSGVSRAARSAVPCRSSVPGHRASRSKYTRGQSQETGSLSKSSGGVGALAKRVLLGPAWADSGSLVFLRDDAGLRTVVSNRRLLRQSWCYSPGLMMAGPSGEERCTPHYTVPVSPQCPQEISRLTLPVFQGAAVSSERFSQSLSAQKCSGAGRLATPSGVSRAARSAVPCRSSAPGHRASRSKYTRGQSQETGSLSRPPGGLGAPAKRVSLGSAWADSGS